MIAGKLGVVIAMVLGGLLTNFVSAGSDSESDKDLQCEPPIDECIRENLIIKSINIIASIPHAMKNEAGRY